MDTSSEPPPTLEGPYSSFEELKVAQKAYEFYHKEVLNVKDSVLLEHYRRRAPNRIISDALKYQRLSLKCFKADECKGEGSGKRVKTLTYKEKCPFVFTFVASPDGESLIRTKAHEVHSHDPMTRVIIMF